MLLTKLYFAFDVLKLTTKFLRTKMSMEISEIKDTLSIIEVLEYYGIQLLKNKYCQCPFHEDKNPSMQVYTDTGTVHCFSGNCHHSGKPIDVIDFIMYKENITKHQAILKAKSLLNIPTVEKSKTTQETPALSLAEVFTILKEQLPRSRNATNYLKTRGILGLKEIGSNHRNGNNPNPYQYNQLKNCIVFPLKDCHGQIVSLYGRSITAVNKGHYYLTNRKGLYPNYLSAETIQLILTESIIDAATLLLHANLPKHYSVLACYGTNGFTKEHSESLKQIENLETIIVWFDGDEAGRAAAKKLQTQLQEQYPEISIGVIDTPKDEDINSLWTNNESVELFTTLLKEAKVVAPQEKTHHQLLTKNDQLLFTIKGQVRNLGDSLKVTLQTLKEGKSIIQKLDLYDYNMLEKHAKQAAKALDISEAIILSHWQNYALELEKQALMISGFP